MAILKIGVLGSGVMGSGIAAHVASAGCQVELLDIVIDDAAPDKLAAGALAALAKSKPALAMHGAFLKRIRPGNLRDHLDRLADCDWVVEVVKEDLPSSASSTAAWSRTSRPAPGSAPTPPASP